MEKNEPPKAPSTADFVRPQVAPGARRLGFVEGAFVVPEDFGTMEAEAIRRLFEDDPAEDKTVP
jgi:hypothetical protein